MVWAPKSLQSNADTGSPEASVRVVVTTEQLSVAPACVAMSANDTEPSPLASNVTVAFCATTLGNVVSFTVTTTSAEFELPLLSVAVNVTVLAPRSSQSNAVLLKL